MMAVQVQYSCVQLRKGLCPPHCDNYDYTCEYICSNTHIYNDEFRMLGIYISMSVIQGGCGLATHVFQYLATKEITVPL